MHLTDNVDTKRLLPSAWAMSEPVELMRVKIRSLRLRLSRLCRGQIPFSRLHYLVSIAICLGLLLLFSAPAFARTMASVTAVCPIDGDAFEDLMMASDSSAGLMLDFKPAGSGAGIWKYPACPRDGMILFREFSDEEIELLKPYVLGEEYQSMRENETEYWLISRMQKLLGDSEGQQADSLLKATWQANEEQYPRYAGEAREMFLKIAAGHEASEGEDIPAMMLAGELTRRLGEFDKARKHFEELRQKPDCTSRMCQPYIEQELKLIEAKNSGPAEIELK